VAGHEHIAPGRKGDPGTGFDWQRLKASLQLPDHCFPVCFRLDKDVVLACLGALFQHELSINLPAKHKSVLDYKERVISSGVVPSSWFKDAVFMFQAVRVHSFLLNKAPKVVRLDYDTALTAMRNKGFYNHLDPCFRANRTILQAVLENPNSVPSTILKHAGSLQADFEFVLACVQRDGLQLAFAAQHLRAKPDIVEEACKNNYKALKYACPKLMKNADFVLKCCKQDGRCLTLACTSLCENLELAQAAVNQCPVWFAAQAVKATRRVNANT
jgi:hypothetical protein